MIHHEEQKKITNNVYILSFVATIGVLCFSAIVNLIGGSLFGFDISSMSAWIGTEQYNTYFNSPNSDLQAPIQLRCLTVIGRNHRVNVCRIFRRGSCCRFLECKRSIQVAALIWIVGSMITCSAQNVAQIGGREGYQWLQCWHQVI